MKKSTERKRIMGGKLGLVVLVFLLSVQSTNSQPVIEGDGVRIPFGSLPGAFNLRIALNGAIECAAMQADEILLLSIDLASGNGLGVVDAIDTLAGMSDCRAGSGIARWMKQRGVRTIEKARELVPEYFRERLNRWTRHGPATYGDAGSLSELAVQHRKARGLSARQNVAVVEYRHNGELHRVPVASGPTGHSESRIINERMPEDAEVTRIYSEREPCFKCWTAITEDRRFARAEVEHTFNRLEDSEVLAWFEQGSSLGAWGGDAQDFLREVRRSGCAQH